MTHSPLLPAATLAAAAACLASCETIRVNARDASPPGLEVSLADPYRLQASYLSAPPEFATPLIDTGRRFRVMTPNDREWLQLIFAGDDEHSGIRRGEAELRVTYRCVMRWAGQDVVSEEKTAYFTRTFGQAAAEGATTYRRSIAQVGFSLEDLWYPACRNWGQVVDVRRGRIADILVHYSAQAWNNGVRDAEPARLAGVFDVRGTLDVNLD